MVYQNKKPRGMCGRLPLFLRLFCFVLMTIFVVYCIDNKHVTSHLLIMTCFDNLSVDLLLEICKYLTFTELFHAFFGLQKRLDDAIRYYPMCINLSKAMNQSHLQSFSFQCRSLILSGLDLHSFQTRDSHLNLESLRGVTFLKMNLLTLHSFVEKLPIHQLESITIGRFTWQYYPVDLYRQVWSLIMNAIDGSRLRYLCLPYHIRYWKIEQLPADFIELKRATLEYISVNQMFTFMSHTPNLRRFQACLTSPHKDLFRYPITLSKLSHLILILHDEWSLKEIQQLFSICPYLKYLILKLEAHQEGRAIFEPRTWQTLIEEKLTDLIFLRLQLNCIIVHPDMEDHDFEEKFNHAEYWLQRKRYFQVTIRNIQRKLL